MIHLDTSFLIRAAFPATREWKLMARWLKDGRALGVSAVAWAEFLCGPIRSDETREAVSTLGEPEPLGAAEAALGAQLYNATNRRRGSLPDCLIAATAISCDAQLATSDPADFQRFEAHGLRLAAMD